MSLLSCCCGPPLALRRCESALAGEGAAAWSWDELLRDVVGGFATLLCSKSRRATVSAAARCEPDGGRELGGFWVDEREATAVLLGLLEADWERGGRSDEDE